MREIYEFRIPERRAAAVLPPDAGVVLGGSVRKMVVPADSHLFNAIREAQVSARARGELFYTFWDVQRRYTASELAAASLFLLESSAVTEQAGEPAGDGSEDSGIALNTRKLPKKDLVVTLAGERVVSQRLAELVLEVGLTGMELRPVRHVERKGDEAMDLTVVPAGRKLLARAAEAGCPHPGWSFWVWLNKPEQESLRQAATDQYWAVTRPERRRRQAAAPPWYQLVIRSAPVPTVVPTRFGIGPFEDDEEGKYRDREALVAGLNVLSECYVAEEVWDGSDFAETREKVGAAGGLVRPSTLLLVSRRVRDLFTEHRVQGVAFEVAHLVRNGEWTYPPL